MKIVFMRSNPVNPDSRVEKEVNSLVQAGHQVTILAWDREKNYKYKTEKINCYSSEAIIHRFGVKGQFGGGIRKNLLSLLKIQKQMYRWLKENINKYDVIHACDFDNGIIAYKIKKKYNKKIVYDIFDFYSASHRFPKLIKKIINKKDIKVINNADATIICSEKRQEQICKARPKKLEIIHNAPYNEIIDFANYSFNINKNKINIGYVGILSKARLLEEMVQCVAKRNDVELHIGGFGQLENYIYECSKKYKNIHFYGKISYANVLKLESEMDIITAIYDPMIENHRYAAPNKFYEGLMLGKLIIMIHNTGMDKIIDENNFGVTIDFSEESFNEGLNNLINCKSKWEEISKNEIKFFNEHYSWKIMGSRLVNLYNELLK